MIVVQGKDTVELGVDDIEQLASRHADVAIDLGTGDGRFAYNYAAEHSDTLVVGLDRNCARSRAVTARLHHDRRALPRAGRARHPRHHLGQAVVAPLTAAVVSH